MGCSVFVTHVCHEKGHCASRTRENYQWELLKGTRIIYRLAEPFVRNSKYEGVKT
jgi:hypothetical protein